ncbi:hypothetical protein NMY22_g3741 [Coprinellus aureogranulatus]|nr:hypothetical protein NMY22_g3741 [Coprinellus aureogranulatus]
MFSSRSVKIESSCGRGHKFDVTGARGKVLSVPDSRAYDMSQFCVSIYRASPQPPLPDSSSAMLKLALLSQLLGVAFGAIGPSAVLHIANQNISPDGFARSAVLAGATPNTLSFPGPLVVGNKGNTFSLNVVDSLTDTTMLRSTSIHWHGSSRRAAPGPMVLQG